MGTPNPDTQRLQCSIVRADAIQAGFALLGVACLRYPDIVCCCMAVVFVTACYAMRARCRLYALWEAERAVRKLGFEESALRRGDDPKG